MTLKYIHALLDLLECSHLGLEARARAVLFLLFLLLVRIRADVKHRHAHMATVEGHLYRLLQALLGLATCSI
jgi:hypothetical protein